MSKEHTTKDTIIGIVLMIVSLAEFASLCTFQVNNLDHNLLGFFGYISAYALYLLFGSMSFLAVISLGAWGFFKIQGSFEITKRHIISAVVILASLSLLACLLGVLLPTAETRWARLLGASYQDAWQFRLGGLLADCLYQRIPFIRLDHFLNIIGTALVSSSALFIALCTLFDINLRSFIISEKEEKKSTKKQKREEEIEEEDEEEEEDLFPHFEHIPEREVRFGNEEPPKKNFLWPLHEKQAIPVISTKENYILPSVELLNIPKKVDLSELKKELKDKADLLEATLMNFGIEAKVGQIHCGPTVTLFEVHPAVGVKVGKIKTLEHDIALNMEATSIRIIAPIPGKAAVGIEIPNKLPQEVSFRELFTSYQQKGSPFKIPLLLGKSVDGELVFSDLTKMPHCIIAGATGSGKSVCINTIVMSILMLFHPDEVRFLMIDPKKVELAPYTDLPHMLAPVITDPNAAAAALSWLVREMEKRYEILKQTGQRNIDAFNKRSRNVEEEANNPIQIPEKLPYFICLIDELADLMMTCGQDIEAPIARIAQMARAVGIHLILATQRPSREVITGLIKANFPARISFKVASRVNSQIVLDEIGAENLLGNGDMLILLPGSSQLIRAQGIFIRDEEINKVIEHISKQRPPQYLIGSQQELETNSDLDDMELDDLFDEAKDIVISTGTASTTFLQRKLKIGYARAASIMDQLEAMGIVTAQDGARPRKVTMSKALDEESHEELF